MTDIYMDYAATTPLDPEVLAAMEPWLREEYGNPSSPYGAARRARAAVDDARERVAAVLGAKAKEIYFTSGGTEAANLALFGRAFWPGEKGKPVVFSAVEHQAVLQTAAFLDDNGWPGVSIPVDGQGVVQLDEWARALSGGAAVAALMYANNEMGAVQPVAEAAAVARRRGVPLFVDAVQAPGVLPLNVEELGCDLLALSAHKFYGPKGAGVLYARSGVGLAPHLRGGGQERGLRAGTENVAAIVGCALALERAAARRVEEAKRLAGLRDRLWRAIKSRVPDVRLNGPEAPRLADNLNVSFPGVDGESLLLNLDRAGLAASSGSACTSGSLRASHVLRALGLTEEEARSSLRFSLGRPTTEDDVDRAAALVAETVARMRQRAVMAARFAPEKR